MALRVFAVIRIMRLPWLHRAFNVTARYGRRLDSLPCTRALLQRSGFGTIDVDCQCQPGQLSTHIQIPRGVSCMSRVIMWELVNYTHARPAPELNDTSRNRCRNRIGASSQA